MIDFFFQLSSCMFTFVNSFFDAHIMLKNKSRVTYDMLLCFYSMGYPYYFSGSAEIVSAIFANSSGVSLSFSALKSTSFSLFMGIRCM